VLAVAGFLLVAEATMTVLWREPFSAISVAGEQAELSRQLSAVERAADRRSAVTATSERDTHRLAAKQRLRELALAFRRQAVSGEPLGRLRIPALGVSQVAVQGTDSGNLKRGPAHYSDTALPGERGTVGIAGHRTTYTAPFRDLDDLQSGDEIELRMPYGRFAYRVMRTMIVDPGQVAVLRNYGYSRLVLTACHPLFSDSQRIVAIANLERATGIPAAAPG
jgi:sortase A